MSSAPISVALPALESLFNNTRMITRRLEELKLPLIAIPDNSPIDLDSMKRYGVEVMIISGVGHFPQMEEPQRFNASRPRDLETPSNLASGLTVYLEVLD